MLTLIPKSKLADFVVLSENIFTIDPIRINKVEVLQTYVGGQLVFDSTTKKILNMDIKDNHINYVEFKATDLEKIKAFYTKAFNWVFTDFGSTYIAFSASGLEGGFEKTDTEIINGALVILYHKDLDSIKNTIIEAGGKINIDTFAFPGGHRFHFIDPSGNELAVWSASNAEN